MPHYIHSEDVCHNRQIRRPYRVVRTRSPIYHQGAVGNKQHGSQLPTYLCPYSRLRLQPRVGCNYRQAQARNRMRRALTHHKVPARTYRCSNSLHDVSVILFLGNDDIRVAARKYRDKIFATDTPSETTLAVHHSLRYGCRCHVFVALQRNVFTAEVRGARNYTPW